MPMRPYFAHTSSTQTRARGRCCRAVLATDVIGMVLLPGYMSVPSVPELPFIKDKPEPTGIVISEFSSPDSPSIPIPTAESKTRDKGPCDPNDAILTACPLLTIALAAIDPGEAPVVTSDGTLTVAIPNKTPREVARLGAPVK